MEVILTFFDKKTEKITDIGLGLFWFLCPVCLNSNPLPLFVQLILDIRMKSGTFLSI